MLLCKRWLRTALFGAKHLEIMISEQIELNCVASLADSRQQHGFKHVEGLLATGFLSVFLNLGCSEGALPDISCVFVLQINRKCSLVSLHVEKIQGLNELGST